MNQSEIRELLKGVSIFSQMDDGVLASLAGLVVTKEYPKDSLVFSQDDPGDAMFVIARGRVKVVLYGESGREVVLSVFRAGDFFGEMALLDNLPRSANVVTLEASTLIVLQRDTFRRYLEQHPSAAFSVMAELCRRLRKADEIISNLSLLDVYGRVARLLRELAQSDGEEIEGGGIRIRKRPTQQDIAGMINTSRETVSRALSEFQRRGLLQMEGKTIVLRPQFYRESGG